MFKSISITWKFLWRNKFLHIAVLLSIAALLWASSPTPRVLAAATNILGNPDFETGSLDPFWQKWGYPASTAMVLNCCSHTPGTSWVGYIVPNGKWVELQTKGLTVGNQVRAGQKYRLQTWVYTNGMTATVAWWVADSPSQTCGTTSSTTWVPISCDFTIPAGTDGKGFNVHIGGNAPSGQWAISDEWFLAPFDQTHWYAEGFKRGTFYGVQAKISTAIPVIREPLFSYATINLSDDSGRWVEAGWIRGQQSCAPRFVYAIQPGAAIYIDNPRPTVGQSYYYTLYRVGPGNWQLQIADSNGQLVAGPISFPPNPGLDSGTLIQAGGEVDTLREINDMGVSTLESLKWADINLVFYPWGGWLPSRVDEPPYHILHVAGDPDNSAQISGNQGNPVPAGAPCP